MARKLTAKQMDRLRFYRTHEINRGRPVGNLMHDPQSDALFSRGMVYVDGSVMKPGLDAIEAEDRPKMKPGTYVRIVETGTGKVKREFGPMSQARADRVEAGALINLDHGRFHTETFSVPEQKCSES